MVRQRLRTRYYRTLGTSVMNSPKFPSLLIWCLMSACSFWSYIKTFSCMLFQFAVKNFGKSVWFVTLIRIEDGTTHFIWAVGRGPLYKLEGLNITSPVNAQTGMYRARFIEIRVSSILEIEIKSENIFDLRYMCDVIK